LELEVKEKREHNNSYIDYPDIKTTITKLICMFEDLQLTNFEV